MPLFFKDNSFAIIPNIQLNLTGFQEVWEWKHIEFEYYVQWGFWGFCTKMTTEVSEILDKNSPTPDAETHKIAAEIAEMSDEEFESILNHLTK